MRSEQSSDSRDQISSELYANVEIITNEFIHFLVGEAVIDMQIKLPNKHELVPVPELNEDSQLS